MMKYVIAVMVFLPLFPYTYNWNVNEKENVIVWSEKKMSDSRVNSIQGKYLDIERRFLSFNGSLCKCPKVNIFFVSEEFLNSFNDGKRGVFGRYFRARATIYITQEMLKRTDFFAHELAHHFYYSCGKSWGSDDAEEARAYEFQRLYKK